MIVIACTDTPKTQQGNKYKMVEGRYDSQLMVLLSSLKINFPHPTTVYCVNFDLNKIKKMESLFPFATFKLIDKLKSPAEMCVFKQEVCEECYNNLTDNDTLLWLDTDIIIRHSIQYLFDSTHNIKIKLRPHLNDIRTAVNTGVFCIRKNPLTIKFMEEWKTLIHKNTMWFWDQISFYIATKNTHIQLENLEHKYNNMWGDLGDAWDINSNIWHCKTGHDQLEWLDEMNKYLTLNNLTIKTLWD